MSQKLVMIIFIMYECNKIFIIIYSINATCESKRPPCNSKQYYSKALAHNSICLVLFFDGAQFNTGSNGTIYVLEAVIANLPPLKRSSFELFNFIQMLFIFQNYPKRKKHPVKVKMLKKLLKNYNKNAN